MVNPTKIHSLTGRIDMALMLSAFLAVKRNRGAAGVDKVSIDLFEANLELNLASLMADLKSRGSYLPMPLRRVYIPKDRVFWRPIGIPAVRDRVAQQVIRALLEPIFEPSFSEFSFGFRPLRNAHQAVEAILSFREQGFKVVVDADIKGFFDNINHDLIIDLVAQRVADGNILQIIRQFLTAGVMEDGLFKLTERGTPQGGVISPLLANIVLNVLDQRLTQAGFRFVRYADDFVVLCPDLASAQQALAFVNDTLQFELGLSLSAEKSSLSSFKLGFSFLGFQFSQSGVTVRQKSIDKLKDKIRDITVRSHNLGPHTFLELNRVLRGFAYYFATPFSSVIRQFDRLDMWIRNRLRCMKFKRISRSDNSRWLIKHLARKGLFSLRSVAT